jgi:hypothetical protein
LTVADSGDVTIANDLTVNGGDMLLDSSGDSVFTMTVGGTSNDARIDFNNGSSVDGGIVYDHNSSFASEKLVLRAGNNTDQVYVTGDGNLQFNSGYGSVATAYGCRAWVNFEGNAVPATLRASGNVSSITDRGVGLYAVNFSTALPDVNYSAVTSGRGDLFSTASGANISTTSYNVDVATRTGVLTDPSHIFCAVFR